jgi:hypothetical protein
MPAPPASGDVDSDPPGHGEGSSQPQVFLSTFMQIFCAQKLAVRVANSGHARYAA